MKPEKQGNEWSCSEVAGLKLNVAKEKKKKAEKKINILANKSQHLSYRKPEVLPSDSEPAFQQRSFSLSVEQR